MANKKVKKRDRVSQVLIFRDEQRVARLRRVAQIAGLVGLLILISGLVTTFTAGNDPRLLYYPVISLGIGWLLSQVGLYLTQRYVRDPRPDEVIDKAIRKGGVVGRLYHYFLPASHVLLTEWGAALIVAKHQSGQISVTDDKWRQSGIGLRRFFGQEGLGNPTRDAQSQLAKLARFIKKNAPDLAEEKIPVGAVILFTHADKKQLQLAGSSLPAMHHSELNNYLRKWLSGDKMPASLYAGLQGIFDKAAGKAIE